MLGDRQIVKSGYWGRDWEEGSCSSTSRVVTAASLTSCDKPVRQEHTQGRKEMDCRYK